MNPRDEGMPRIDGPSPQPATPLERAGRIFFLFGAGLLMSVLVSCACGPVR